MLLRLPARKLLRASALALLLLSPVLSGCGGSQQPPGPGIQAQWAETFRDSIGVNVHLAWLDTSYARFDPLRRRLLELGVRHIRDGACPGCPVQIEHLNALAQDGIRSDLIVGDPRNSTGTLQQDLATIRDQLGSSVEALEGPNEWDASGDPAWAADLRAYTQQLYAAARADATLRRLPVYGPSLVSPASRGQLGNLSAFLDLGNVHAYPGTQRPDAILRHGRDLARQVSGSKPVVATESGYHTAMATTSGFPPVSERAAAAYVPRLFLDTFVGGYQRTYLYQLADPKPDPSQADFNEHFGLLDSNLAPKPAYMSLRNLLAAIDPREGQEGDAGRLDFNIVRPPFDLHSLLLRSGNGDFALVLWRSVDVWDGERHVDVTPPPASLQVVLRKPASAQLYDPVVSSGPRARWTSARRFRLSVGGDPLVLRVHS